MNEKWATVSQDSLKPFFSYFSVICMAISVGIALPGFKTFSMSSWLLSLVYITPSIVLVFLSFFWFTTNSGFRLDLSDFLVIFKAHSSLFIISTVLALFCGAILSQLLAIIHPWYVLGRFVLFGSIIWFLAIGLIKPELGPISFIIIFPFLEFSRARLHARWYDFSEAQGAAEWLKGTILSWQNHDVVLIMFAVGFTIHLLIKKKFSLRTPLDYFIALFLAWVFISLIAARDPVVAINAFMAKWILPITMFYTTVYAVRKNIKIDIFAYSLIILLFFSCILTIQNAAVTGSYIETIGTGRAKVWGIIGGQISPWVVLILPVTIYYFLRANSGIKIRIFSAITILLSIGMLVWEMSRGALLALFISAIVSFLFYRQYWKRYVLLFGLIIFSLIIFKNKIVELILLSRPLMFEKPLSIEQNFSRLYLWQEGLEIVKNSPLLGIGPGGFWLLQIGVYTLEDNSHNMVLEVALESGIIAAIFFCIMYLWPLYQAMQKKLISNKGQLRDYNMSPWILGLIGFFVYLMTSTTWEWGYGVVVMIMLAVVVSRISTPQIQKA
jgi:O-antigen ligase